MNDAYYYRSFATDIDEHHNHHSKKHHHHHNNGKLITPENALNKHHPHTHYNSQLHGHYEQHPRPYGHHRPNREVIEAHSSEQDATSHPSEAHNFHFKPGSELETGLERLYAEHVDQLDPFDYSHDPVPHKAPVIIHHTPEPVHPIIHHTPRPVTNDIHHGETPEEFKLYGDLSGITPQTTGMTPQMLGMGKDIDINHTQPNISPAVHHNHHFHRHHHYVGEDLGGGILYDPTGELANRHNEDMYKAAIVKPGVLDDKHDIHPVGGMIPSSGDDDSLGGGGDMHGMMVPTLEQQQSAASDFLGGGLKPPTEQVHTLPAITHVPSNHHLGHSHTGPAHNFGDHPGVGVNSFPDSTDNFIGDQSHISHPLLKRTPVVEDDEGIGSIENVHDAQDLQDRLNAIKKDNEEQEQQQHNTEVQNNPLDQFSNTIQGGLNFLGGLLSPQPQTTSHLAIGGAMNSLPSHLSGSKLKKHTTITGGRNIKKPVKAHLATTSDGNLNKNNEYNKYMNDIVGQVKQNSYLFMDAGLIGLGALLLLPHVGIKAIPGNLNKLAWTASISALAVGILAHMANPHGRAFAAGEHGGGGGGPHGGAGHFEGGHIGGHGGEHFGGHEGFRGGGRWVGGRWVGGYYPGYYGYGYPGYPYPGYPAPPPPYDPYLPGGYPYYGYPGWGGFYGGRYYGRGFGHLGHFGGHEGHFGGHEHGGHEGGHEHGGEHGGHAGGGGGHSHAHNARSFFAPAIFPDRSYFNHKSSFKHHEEGVHNQKMLNPSDVLLPREIDTSHYILGSRPAIIDSNMVPSPLISDVY